jgi:ATP/maltotriose-dependent transcriptional regulator MalT
MAEGLSNQQISDKLMISLNTAKTHVYRVFDKLDANDRLAAVNRARDLKLIK